MSCRPVLFLASTLYVGRLGSVVGSEWSVLHGCVSSLDFAILETLVVWLMAGAAIALPVVGDVLCVGGAGAARMMVSDSFGAASPSPLSELAVSAA